MADIFSVFQFQHIIPGNCITAYRNPTTNKSFTRRQLKKRWLAARRVVPFLGPYCSSTFWDWLPPSVWPHCSCSTTKTKRRGNTSRMGQSSWHSSSSLLHQSASYGTRQTSGCSLLPACQKRQENHALPTTTTN